MKKRNKKMFRKGELTSGQLVSIIILILSFVVILLLWRAYYWNPIIDKEACHQSIVFRSSVNFGLIKSSEVVPLKCQTEKICMSIGNQDCPQVGKNTKDNAVEKIKLSKDPLKAKEEVLDRITEAMYDCHSMLGEGKLQFMPEGFFDKATTSYFSGNPNDLGNKNYCLICTRIVLDEEARRQVGDITYSELYLALSKKVTPDKKTYLEYLHPDWKDWRNSANLFQKIIDDNIENHGGTLSNTRFEDWKINLNEEGGVAIIAQMTTKDYWPIITGTAAVIGGVSLAATGIGAPVGVSLIGAGVAGGATFWYNSPTGDYVYSPPNVEPYSLERLQSMQCDSFETAP